MILVISGSRADYGCLFWVMQEMNNQKMPYELFEMERGLSLGTFENNAKIIFDKFESGKYDSVMVLGDRWEILQVCNIAIIFHLLIIHLGGGEISKGSYDDNIRQAISMISNYHFVVTEKAKQSLLSIGIAEEKVFISGSPRLDYIHKFKPESKEKKPLVIYHPETKQDIETIQKQTVIFFDAIETLRDYNLLLPNADFGSEIIINEIQKRKLKYIANDLIISEWVDLLYNCNYVIGNSSAGIMEAQIFLKPVINVGDRQKGRERCGNVYDVEYDKQKILNAIETIPDRYLDIVNIYGDGNASKYIVETLKGIL